MTIKWTKQWQDRLSEITEPDHTYVLAEERECFPIRGQAVLLGPLAEMTIGSRDAAG
ncbi:MAG: hypothetical protein ABR921_01690 [Candidatus Sulfotelmatobacter sp.]